MFRLRLWIVAVAAIAAAVPANAQTRRVEPAEVRCPSVLGVGVNTDLAFCDVLIQRDTGLGIIVIVPPHRGEATLSFNLHNRHTYSEAEERAGRAYAKHIASVAVATMDGKALARRVALSEFRSAKDLVDRVSGGASQGGVKAVAPTGVERVYLTISAEVDQVAIVGQSLEIVRLESRDTFRSPGRPVAVISDVQVEYRPRR